MEDKAIGSLASELGAKWAVKGVPSASCYQIYVVKYGVKLRSFFRNIMSDSDESGDEQIEQEQLDDFEDSQVIFFESYYLRCLFMCIFVFAVEPTMVRESMWRRSNASSNESKSKSFKKPVSLRFVD